MVNTTYTFTNGVLGSDVSTKELLTLSFSDSNILFSFLVKMGVRVNISDMEKREFTVLGTHSFTGELKGDIVSFGYALDKFEIVYGKGEVERLKTIISQMKLSNSLMITY